MQPAFVTHAHFALINAQTQLAAAPQCGLTCRWSPASTALRPLSSAAQQAGSTACVDTGKKIGGLSRRKCNPPQGAGVRDSAVADAP